MQMIAGSVERRVELRGLTFSYLEWGDAAAPPLVLLHGLTGHAHIWDHMGAPLAKRYRLLVPDQRGHGETGHADRYDTADFVDDLDALVGHWGLERFALMGLSMGGHNALAYTATHPQRVSHLVVIDIPPGMDRERGPNRDAELRTARTGHPRFATFDEAVEAARPGNPTAPEDNLRYRTMNNIRKQSDGTFALKYDHRVQALWNPADLWVQLPSVKAPVLLVRGGLTTVLPERTADRMIATLPDAEFAQVDDSGHSVPTDRPEKLTPIVLDWLQRRGY
jgi:pimeloyl-ACP methyl ester carboxylesterase